MLPTEQTADKSVRRKEMIAFIELPLVKDTSVGAGSGLSDVRGTQGTWRGYRDETDDGLESAAHLAGVRELTAAKNN